MTADVERVNSFPCSSCLLHIDALQPLKNNKNSTSHDQHKMRTSLRAWFELSNPFSSPCSHTSFTHYFFFKKLHTVFPFFSLLFFPIIFFQSSFLLTRLFDPSYVVLFYYPVFFTLRSVPFFTCRFSLSFSSQHVFSFNSNRFLRTLVSENLFPNPFTFPLFPYPFPTYPPPLHFPAIVGFSTTRKGLPSTILPALTLSTPKELHAPGVTFNPFLFCESPWVGYAQRGHLFSRKAWMIYFRNSCTY